MIRVVGRTFDHRTMLRQLGGSWNGIAKEWEFHFPLTEAIKTELRSLVGCQLIENDASPKPAKRNTFDYAEWFTRIKAQESARDGAERDGRHETLIYGDDRTYFNYFKDKNPVAFFGFSNLGELVDFVEAIPREYENDRKRGQAWETDNAEWFGTPNMRAALDLARDGWPEGSALASDILETLNIDHATRRRRSLAVSGGHVSVGRLLAGHPAHMVKRPKLPGRKIVTLFVENAASSGVAADDLITRAAVIGAICDLLEMQGFSCEIVSITSVEWAMKPITQTCVTIKTAGEPMNVNDLVFSLGHPSFLRRLHFACVNSCDQLERIWQSQGMPSKAFSTQYATGRDEFYIKPLEYGIDLDGETIMERALNMVQIIAPDNLPIIIEE